MAKTLTQADFKGAPDWVMSAAVDDDGYVWGYEGSKKVIKDGLCPYCRDDEVQDD